MRILSDFAGLRPARDVMPVLWGRVNKFGAIAQKTRGFSGRRRPEGRGPATKKFDSKTAQIRLGHRTSTVATTETRDPPTVPSWRKSGSTPED